MRRSYDEPCSRCSGPVPRDRDRCPHCGAALAPPNVRAASRAEEQSALSARYEAACADARRRGAEPNVALFERAVAGESRAVLARSFGEVQRLAGSDRQLYATYYGQIEAEARLSDDDETDAIRRAIDDVLFPGYGDGIRFAALSLDGRGLPHYGECSLALRDSHISDRATVFEENSVTFARRHDIRVSGAYDPPAGYRAIWARRDRLCVAKLAGRIGSTTQEADYAGLLLSAGATAAADDFVEVHVYGPLSIRSVERVTWTVGKRRQPQSVVRRLRAALSAHGVTLEET